nr:hypothetical protein [uncultured Flavobacterium sp.]
MKVYFFLIYLLFIGNALSAQNNKSEGLNRINGVTIYEGVVESDIQDKNVLWENALFWTKENALAYNQKITQDKNRLLENLMLLDSSGGRIVSKQRFVIERPGMNCLYEYEVAILVGDQKYKYRFSEFKILSIAMAGVRQIVDYGISIDDPKYKPSKALQSHINKEILNTIKALNERMSKAKLTF